ncbi:helix-turn-helix domain-containing protein [Corynebacterium diphtheriae]|uniref:helix-turn-helix domain-containing protein n=1 Tax=Corynebacterium diphtheriae TaxID=1717 RepID=UPI0013CC9649|nr:XRE family transcriptional regulator [Corynebacterium diphtheriae]CAB0580655.1 ImmA/IrrE family metallo-endopeptidase [Corynebacterium diphtheriae]CAB0581510.1 ImmA/IrrE family metallo-endopeptidase [Corynebacterium diphtheriae]CAB0831202.1 ImmA/IrrE family metallo-endopeptidase [Corynebacterium diphtheriae]
MYENSNGQRLRDLRFLHGMTQKAFAKALGTPQPHLSQVERGLKPAGSLIAAATFTFTPPAGFFEAPVVPYVAGSLNFRTKKLTARTMDAANTTFGELERQARAKLTGTRYLNISRNDLPDRSEPFNIQQINRIADETRAFLRIQPSGPVPNVTRAVERAGIPVVYLENPFVDITDIDGISSPQVDIDRGVIAARRDHDGARTRFTRAHELGHLVMHTARRPGLESIRETEAHRFAGAFLMPVHDALEQLSPTLTLEGFAQVKARYAMSISALVRRAYELGIVSYDRYRSLNIQISSRGWRKTEPVSVVPETPLLIKDGSLSTGTHSVSEVDRPSPNRSTADVIPLFKHE